jgi:hypothetical protein
MPVLDRSAATTAAVPARLIGYVIQEKVGAKIKITR